MEDQRLRIRLAGACAVGTLSGTWERSVPTSQGRLVLARLALAEAPVARDELAELLWPADMPQSWERHLSAVVSKLRRVLADAPSASIAGEPGTYELRLPPGSVVDVVDAAAALEHGRQALAAGRLDEALGASAEAATVARRPFLPGTDALWADDRRDAWRRVLLGCLDVAVEVAIRRGDPGGVAAAREALALDPYREAGYRNLMRLHLATGERAAASDVYRQCRAATAPLVPQNSFPHALCTVPVHFAPENGLLRPCVPRGNGAGLRRARRPGLR